MISLVMVLPSKLRAIETEAFRGGKFTSVYLGSNVRSIASKAFAYSPNLRVINLPDSLESIDPNAFVSSSNVIFVCRGGSTAALFAEEHDIPLVCR